MVAKEMTRWRLGVAHALAGLLLPPHTGRKVRGLIYRAGGVKLAVGVEVAGRVLFSHPNVTIARGCYIAPGCELHPNAKAAITLGRNVALAPGVRILVEEHDTGDPARRSGAVKSSAVSVGDGAWIGAGAILLPGAHVGAGCVVAAGAVVRGTLDADWLYGGVPARALRDLEA